MKPIHSFKILLLFLLINCLTHVVFLNLPPSGTHVWRQCNSLAMSRNFAQESMNIFETRIDRRDGTSGITGSHFPLYEWCVAALYKSFGEHDATARIFSLLLFTLFMFASYRLCLEFGHNQKIAIIAGLLMLSVPQFYYDSINAMPDTMAICTSTWAAYYFIKHLKTQNKNFFIFSLILAIVSGLIKFQFLILPYSMLAYELKNKTLWKSKVILFVLSLLPVVFWYRYAIEQTQLNNLKEFGLWIKEISLNQKLETIWGNLISDLPEKLIGWPLTLFLIYQLFFNKIKTALKLKPIYWFWLLQFVVFYVVAIERMQNHSYYFMTLLPLFVFVVLKNIQNEKRTHQVLMWVFALNMVWAIVRIVPSRWTHEKMQIPEDFKRVSFRDSIKEIIPKGKQVLIGPDVSGCIYFYYTNTKGYSFATAEEFKEKGPKFIQEIKDRGIEYLVYEDKYNMSKMVAADSNLIEIKNVGNFRICQIN
jgi:hypothetical protein